MKPTTKDNLIRFFLSGLICASLFAAYDLEEGNKFSFWEFLVRMILFGFFMLVVYDVSSNIGTRKKKKNIS